MSNYYGIDTKDPGEYMAVLNDLRWKKLQKQIAVLFENHDYYRQRFLEAGVNAPGDIRSLDDFRALPSFLDKARHRQSQEESLERYNHPYGLHLSCPLDQVVHLAATSGTTGQPTWYAFTRQDQDITNKVLGRIFQTVGIRPGDTTLHAFGLSLWLAGFTWVQALEAYGARPVAVGAEGGVPKILRYIQYTRPRALLATPSMAAQLIEKAPAEIGKTVGELGIEILLCTGEPGIGIDAIRSHLARSFNAQVFDATGGAWHNGTVSCGGDQYHGMHHVGEDHCFRYDLVDPETKQPLPLVDGAVGEAIHTALEYQAAPAFRNATGDILRLNVGECPHCGRFGARMTIIGRADDMLNVKGAKVYPSALQDVVATFQPQVSGQMRIRLDGPPPRVTPPLKLVVEAAEAVGAGDWDGLAKAIEQRTRDILAIRPKVSIVPFGSLARTGAKTKLIEIVGHQN